MREGQRLGEAVAGHGEAGDAERAGEGSGRLHGARHQEAARLAPPEPERVHEPRREVHRLCGLEIGGADHVVDRPVHVLERLAVVEGAVEGSGSDPTALLGEEAHQGEGDHPREHHEGRRHQEADPERGGQDQHQRAQEGVGEGRRPDRPLAGDLGRDRLGLPPYLVGPGGGQVARQGEVGVGQRTTRHRRYGGQLGSLPGVHQIEQRADREQCGPMAAAGDRYSDVLPTSIHVSPAVMVPQRERGVTRYQVLSIRAAGLASVLTAGATDRRQRRAADERQLRAIEDEEN